MADDTMMSDDVETLASQIVEGSTRALARGLTWVESGGKRAEALSAQLYPHTGRAQIVGVTGAPGSGKSTLVRSLALVARARGRIVGELRAMLTLIPAPEEAWMPPVLPASAARDEGIEPIADALDGHVAYLKTSGELERRRRRIVTARVLKIAQDLVAETMLGGEGLGTEGAAGATLLERVARRELAPHACARLFLKQIARRTEGGIG